MTTVTTLITDAMFGAGVLGQDQTATSGDINLVLRRLNRMLDTWSNEKLMIYAADFESFTMVAGTQSYSTSLITAGRPIKFSSMFVRLSNIDWPVEQVDEFKWESIAYKLTQSIPQVMYYDMAYPNGLMYFYPVPYAAFTCFFAAQRQLTSTALTLTTTLSMPPGYEAAIVANLAVDICPSFGKQPSRQMMMDAVNTKGWLKRTNYLPLEMSSPFEGDADASSRYLLPQW